MRLNLYDDVTKRHVTITPELTHTLPGGTELLCFEAYDDAFKATAPDRLTLSDFKVLTHAGWVTGVRTTIRPPRGVFLNVEALQAKVFSQFDSVITAAPLALAPHPLVHVIPDGYPGAGVIVVHNVAALRADGEDLPAGLTFVEREARERACVRRSLRRLGFTLNEGAP